MEYIKSTDIVPGGNVRITRLPNGTIVTPVPGAAQWRHPFICSMNVSSDGDPQVFVSEGTVNDVIPFVNEEVQAGGKNPETGQYDGVPVIPKEEGTSWIAVGVNVYTNELDEAQLDPETAGFHSLRLQEISELPPGRGSGGVHRDDEGWAWYAIARLEWSEKQLVDLFQIVYHNLQHSVTAAAPRSVIDQLTQSVLEPKAAERHYFFPA